MKKSNVFLIICIMVLVGFIGFACYSSLLSNSENNGSDVNNSSNGNNISIFGKKNISKDEENKIVGLSSATKYKQVITSHLKMYLSENNIDVVDDLEIDLNDIEKSTQCSGKLKFDIQDETTFQNIDINCNDDNSNLSDFQIYTYNMNDIEPSKLYKVNDGFILVSFLYDSSHERYNRLMNKLSIIKYDDNFNKKWDYIYINDESNYMSALFKENQKIIMFINSFREVKDNYYFLINIGNSKGYGNDRLLILNSDDGMVALNKRFENSNINYILHVDDDNIYLTGDNYYEYNIKNDTLLRKKFKCDEEILQPLSFTNDLIYYQSAISKYVDSNLKEYSKGINSLYIFDSNLEVKKHVNLDDSIKSYLGDDIGMIVYDRTIVGDNGYIYVLYKYLSYSGILILDLDLNVINNIYLTESTNINDIEYLLNISDFYIYNGQLYILTDRVRINYMELLVYKGDGSELISKKIYETFDDSEFKDGYSFSIKSVLSGDDSGVSYYQFMSDFENHEGEILNPKSYLKMDNLVY